MSTNFEYYLYRFIEYCIEGDDDGWSKDFKYKSSDFYEYDFGGGLLSFSINGVVKCQLSSKHNYWHSWSIVLVFIVTFRVRILKLYFL